MRSAVSWLESLSPWPTDGFGTERMEALLRALGNPERAFPSVHVVGTNGKSTATREIAALLRTEGLDVAAYTSPHVSGWHERLDTEPETFERAVARVRDEAERLGATQFEVLTAAALAEFAFRGVDAAVVEAGLGGRLDATNVLDARVVLLTNVSLEHTAVLGETRGEIAREKLAVAKPGAIVVLPDEEFRALIPANEIRIGGAREAAEAFAGRPLDAAVEVVLPGRLEWRGADEVRDGAHTPEGVAWLARHLPRRDWTIVASVLSDKDVEAMLRGLAELGETLVATQSANARALPAQELGARAEPFFRVVEIVDQPAAAVARARTVAGTAGAVLVTGSLYLLADLSTEA